MMSFRSALVLVAFTGFNALSFEILWSRLYSFLSASRAPAFAGMLGFYLLGLALGSLWSIRFQKRHETGNNDSRNAAVARLVLQANAAAFLLAPVVSWAAMVMPYGFTYPLVMLVSGVMGTLLPLICHFSMPPDARVGSRLSKIYLANIAGSGAGSLLTGFVLMEYLPLRWISLLLLAISAGIFIMLHPAGGLRCRARHTALKVLAAGVILTPLLHWQFWERIQKDPSWHWNMGQPFATVIESRSGVIAVTAENLSATPPQPAYIFGGGAYDGVIAVKPALNEWLVRAYCLSALHSNPEEVLMIGLSGGSWGQIVAANPQVKRLTIVEINHSYNQVIAAHECVRSLLSNPKVEIIIDDGRRWLERNPDRKFDAILMNTTHHWREFAGNLLSADFLKIASSHFRPHGIFQYNTTDSARVARTALDAFPHAMMVLNNVVISPDELHFDRARWQPVLENYEIDGRRMFDPADARDQEVLKKMLLLPDTLGKDPAACAALSPLLAREPKYRLQNRAQMEATAAGARPITDDNLGHEYE